MPFNAQIEKDRLIDWIREYFEENGPNAKAVLGISGGKDSTIAAKLCCEAIGKNRVVGLQMPNRTQRDLQDSHDVCEWLGIEKFYINIGPMVTAAYDMVALVNDRMVLNETVTTNFPARVRMSMLYIYANQFGARVVCTGNASEGYIGWSTRWGDEAGDFAPLKGLTATEVIAIGDALEVPHRFIHKAPEDGMSGRTDEENFGFTYKELDAYIRGDRSMSQAVIAKIEKKHAKSQFKRDEIPMFTPLF
jgi:NAD+ synthase